MALSDGRPPFSCGTPLSHPTLKLCTGVELRIGVPGVPQNVDLSGALTHLGRPVGWSGGWSVLRVGAVNAV